MKWMMSLTMSCSNAELWARWTMLDHIEADQCLMIPWAVDCRESQGMSMTVSSWLLSSTAADADGEADHLMLITADLTMRLEPGWALKLDGELICIAADADACWSRPSRWGEEMSASMKNDGLTVNSVTECLNSFSWPGELWKNTMTKCGWYLIMRL